MALPSITCPRCGRTSWHPIDVAKRYCGACYQWHAEFTLEELREGLSAADQALEAVTPDTGALVVMLVSRRLRAILEELRRRYVPDGVEHADC